MPAPYFDITKDRGFKVFHELMLHRVNEVLLVSSAYDAFILEEDGSLASRIINEYHGLNLSKPPRLTSVSTGAAALELMHKKHYDLVITTPYVGDMDAFCLGCKIKEIRPQLPVILLTANLQYVTPVPGKIQCQSVDSLYLWTGSTDLFLAIIKNIEDHRNVSNDTKTAKVRILILVEDSPLFRSSILPMLYKVVVHQTQSVLDESLNEEHRFLKMRARPKILLASSYEDALKLYIKYKKYVFGIVSDTRYFQNNTLEDEAGLKLLSYVRKKEPDMPLLLLSSNAMNREKGEKIPAVFLDKNDPNLLDQIKSFFQTNLGFGPFIFRLPNGTEVAKAHNFHDFERKIATIPDESLKYHAENNHFSAWIMARSEIGLASWMGKIRLTDFNNLSQAKEYLLKSIHDLRKSRQKGVVVSFNRSDFDPAVMDFIKIGEGSMGGKARGIAFMSSVIHRHPDFLKKFPDVVISIPKTCVILEGAYNSFIEANKLYYLSGGSDRIIAKRFLEAKLPDWLQKDLRTFLKQIDYPLAIRSSSLLEDALFRPYAGLYKTYMLNNNAPDFELRYQELAAALKLVYASSYFAGPRAFSRSIAQNRKDSMAVIIQQLTGNNHGDYCYPAISGVAQSYNYYPLDRMKPEDGVAHIALGFGKTVVDGESSLRFSPKYPKMIPQFGSVDDTLKNSQRFFYGLDRTSPFNIPEFGSSHLTKREISEAQAEYPVQMLTSTYIPEEHRIRDVNTAGPKVVTFAQILKNNLLPLADIISEFIELGRKGLGCQVEMEFSANLPTKDTPAEFNFLQIRPMVAGEELFDITITKSEKAKAFCHSHTALGQGKSQDIHNIIIVKPETFFPAKSREIAKEIGRLNGIILRQKSKYLLIGPGRWGSADYLLGIPVQWQEISAVGAIVELRNDKLSVEPSQGTHFFQNITSLGIPYMTVDERDKNDLLNWQTINAWNCTEETTFLKQIQLDHPLTIKIDGRNSEGVIY